MKQNESAFLDGIVEIANSPKIKAEGHPIKKWMVVRVLMAEHLLLEELKREADVKQICPDVASDCCYAKVHVENGGIYVCSKCGYPCVASVV